jgi:cardiolipin synthase
MLMRGFFKVLFSRYSVCAILILIDLVLMILLFEFAASFSVLMATVARAFCIVVFVSLINRDTNPEFKLTWLAVAAVAPVFGTVLYVIFSQRYLTAAEKRFLKQLYTRIDSSRCALEDDSADRCLEELAKKDKRLSGYARAMLRCDSLAAIYPEDVLKYYPSGEEMYVDMLAAIDAAERYVFLEYFIVDEGKMWDGIYERLKRKVREGVDVRMLYDDIGSMKTLPANFDKLLRRDGIKCYRFSKVTPVPNSSHNNRDHRKILAVDGKIAFTGGVNIADEYINCREKFGHWKDAGVAVRGRAALGFTRLFLVAYDLTVREFSNYQSLLAPEPINDAEPLSAGGFVIPIGSGPAPLYRESVGKEALMNMIDLAAESLYVTTPYLIIDYDLTEALRRAARRGVDVRIITPGIPDRPLIKLMTKSSYPRLLEAGVRIFEYTPGFMHAKCVVADNKMAMVGSINLDYRSLVHHFEDALLIFSSRTIDDISGDFIKTLGVCEEMSGEGIGQTFKEKALRSLMRIIAPLL